jgi:galactose mutarotase-like enzyme
VNDAITLTTARSRLTIEPRGGCVATSWLVDGAEVLALPAPLEAFLASARTGGIPLLYPWANRLRADRFEAAGRAVDLSRVPNLKRDGNGLPMHGLLLRWKSWHLGRHGDAGLEARLDWRAHDPLMAAWPFPHTLRVAWQLRDETSTACLDVTTRIDADGGCAVPAAFGWHPYIAVPTVAGARLTLPSRRPVALDARGLPEPRGPRAAALPAGDAPCCHGDDALFERSDAGRGSAAVHVAARDVRVDLGREYPFLQLYSPQASTSGVACIEPMTSATSALTDGAAPVVAAGGSFSATFSMSVQTDGRPRADVRDAAR